MSTQAAPRKGTETVTVVGASGLIGTRVVEELRARGHHVIAASRRDGVDAFTGVGLDEALRQATVVVDVTNPAGDASPDPVAFFTTSTRNLLAAEARLGLRHHVLLSIVGTDRLAEAATRATSGARYFHAKHAQEELIRASGIPFTILRSTQFYEFLPVIAASSTDAGTVRVPAALLQPVAADDVARTVVDVALSPPLLATIELAGPAPRFFDDAVTVALRTSSDPLRVVSDPAATYFGVPIERDTLVPRSSARYGDLTLEEWVGLQSLAIVPSDQGSARSAPGEVWWSAATTMAQSAS